MAMPLSNLFADLDRTGVSPQFHGLREAARDRLKTMAPPTARDEDWRFTSVAPLVEAPFRLTGLTGEVADEVLRALDHVGEPLAPDALKMTFVNGRLLKGQSAWLNLPVGVEVGALADPTTNAKWLQSVVRVQDGYFTALNTSLLHDGAAILIPAGVVLERPIEIVYHTKPGHEKTTTQPRTVLIVGENAHATILERYVGQGNYFTNAVTEISVGPSAVVDHVKVQEESPTAFHVATSKIAVHAKSNFTTHYLSLGGALVRNEVRVRFDGEHAEATVNGLYLASGKQHIDNFTVIDHAQPNCASHELYKGILADKSHGVFNGKIFVRKDAQKTDAKQTNKVLLLSDDATINTKPQLEIFADDVKCTHGATVGQLDPVQLFYLQSRGIPLEAARKLLTFAFANDIVNRVKIEAIREELEARIVR
jgi:Fe-S cluster assembly protein SufD